MTRTIVTSIDYVVVAPMSVIARRPDGGTAALRSLHPGISAFVADSLFPDFVALNPGYTA
jgi:hypothetical protein